MSVASLWQLFPFVSSLCCHNFVNFYCFQYLLHCFEVTLILVMIIDSYFYSNCMVYHKVILSRAGHCFCRYKLDINSCQSVSQQSSSRWFSILSFLWLISSRCLFYYFSCCFIVSYYWTDEYIRCYIILDVLFLYKIINSRLFSNSSARRLHIVSLIYSILTQRVH